ncbi:MAG TPA: hypothetical protein VH186_19840 [Chloroflexia bacterium]|nr:hypothetical protein [Chloroflexia bacterium]
MSQVPLEPLNTSEESTKTARGKLSHRELRGLWAEIAPLWALLRSPLFYLGLLVAFISLVAVYQLPFTKNIGIDDTGDRAYLRNYYATERYQGFVYRWTQPSSSLYLPGVGQPANINVRMELSPRPPGAPPTAIRYHYNGNYFATVQLSPQERKFYEVSNSPPKRSIFSASSGDMDIWMIMDPYLAKGDSRPFGVVVSQIQIQASGFFDSGRFTIPAWGTLVALFVSLVVIALAASRAGWSSRLSVLLMLGVDVLLVVGLAINRPLMGLTAPVLLVSLVVAYVFMATGLRFVDWWLNRKGFAFGPVQARWLGLIFLLAFSIRATGINHPSFQTLDHGFRIHETYALFNQPSLIFTRYYNMNTYSSIGSDGGEVRSVALGQWEVAAAIPYSPLFYITDFPLAGLFHNDEKAFLYWTNLYALWWDCTALFLLYIIARQGLGKFGNIAGLLGSCLMVFFPLSFLMPSDGGYPTMQASWLTLLFFALLSSWFAQRGQKPMPVSWKAVTGAGVVMGLAMLAHTATMLMLLGFMGLLVALVILWGRNSRYLWRPLTLTGVIGVALSFGIYYGFYVIPLLTQTLPAVASKVEQGQKVGAGSETLKGFRAELMAHFHLFPFVILLVALAYLIYARWRASRLTNSVAERAFEAEVSSEIPHPFLLMLLAWLGTFLVFSLVATKVNLLHKHMIFATPLIALGCGLALSLLLEWIKEKDYLHSEEAISKARPSWLLPALWGVQGLIALLAIYFISAGSYTWFIRVVNYVLPAGTG